MNKALCIAIKEVKTLLSDELCVMKTTMPEKMSGISWFCATVNILDEYLPNAEILAHDLTSMLLDFDPENDCISFDIQFNKRFLHLTIHNF